MMQLDELMMVLESLNVKCPHGVLPGAMPGTEKNVAVDRDTWEHYQWNPPEYLLDLKEDPDADPKPTWDQLQAGLPTARLVEARREKLAVLRAEVQRRITEDVYGCRSEMEEIFLRLAANAGELASKDSVRRRLLERYKVLQEAIESATQEDLDKLDPTFSGHWVA